MSNTIATALSGALAAQTRLAGSASNVANLRTTGVLPGPDGQVPDGSPRAYEAVRTTQTALTGADGRGIGTLATNRPANPAVVAAADPNSPFANPDGLVEAPNVDLVGERVQQIQAGAAYKASLAVIRAQDELERKTLNLTA